MGYGLAGAVIGIGLNPENYPGQIGLAAVEEKPGDSGGLSHGNQKHARGKRIQGTGMADLLHLKFSLQSANHRGRGNPLRLIYYKNPVFHTGRGRVGSGCVGILVVLFPVLPFGCGLDQGVQTGGLVKCIVPDKPQVRHIF